MAPALVEHSTAKERNSISKEYSKLRSCLSPFDIVLLEKFGHPVSTNSFVDKSVKNCNFLDMNSGKKQRQNLSFAEKKNDVKSLKDISVINLPNIKNLSTCDAKTGYKNGTLDYKFDKISISGDSSPVYCIKNNTTEYDCKTTEIRPIQPVAALDNTSIVNYLQLKKESCGLKFYDLNRSMNKLNSRLRLLQSKNISSHVASHVNKPDIHESSKSKSTHTDTKNKKDISFKNSELSLQKPWQELRKIHDMVSVNVDDTDFEDDLEIRQRIPVGRSKRKCDNPPPPLEALHQWKIKRAHIGSQCSWLSLKISTLDKKIAELDELHKKQKSERKTLKKNTNFDDICSTKLDTPEDENELNVTPPLVEEQICRRVLPYTDVRRHYYIEKPLNTEKRKRGCRCLSSSGCCLLCLHSKSTVCTDFRNTRAAKLDHSYHSTLSYENDVSLSFLLEETLRKQRINTKVTISKPTKKKKKQKIKEGSGHTESLEKDPGGHKHSSSTKLSSDKNHVKSKGERSKLDELPTRKRSSVLESTVRSKKSRKLSESEESWKPTTPTSELNSPLASSLPTSAFFPLKQRKKASSSGGDYDINNIVIPYSMAATTRLERIQYKEIPTPGWRSVEAGTNKVVEPEETELTDDDIFIDRHTRCEVTEKKKFADYYRPVLRRRPYHLSESTASGPPSPLIHDELARSNINTPIDSPVTNLTGKTTGSRVVNVIAVPEEEREPIWSTRTYPLDDTEFKSLRICSTATSTVTSSDMSAKPFPVFKYPNSSQIFDTPLQTPLSTPAETPIPSPSCSPDGTLSDLDTSEGANPHNWTVKAMIDPSMDVVTTDTQRTGIVLKLAKK